MPIAYSVDLDCVPRQELGSARLASAVQSFYLAHRIEETYRAAGEADRSDSEKTFTERARQTGGTEDRTTRSLAELKTESAPLAALSSHCADCAASLSGQSFGCVQSIAFPIPRDVERWLLDQTGPPESATGQLLRVSVQQMGLGTAGLIADWRKAGFIEAPYALRTEHANDPQPITGDAMFHAMFMSGDLSGTQLFSLLLFTRAIEPADGGDTDDLLRRVTEFQLSGGEGSLPEFRFCLAPEPGDAPGLIEMKTFLLAAFRAFSMSLGLKLHVG